MNTPQFLITFSGIGFQVCEELFTNIFEELVDFGELILKDINYKDQIARYFHKTFNKPIKYKEIEVSDDPNEKIYTMAALDVDENILTVGKGNTKKRAEQQAAKNALIHFNLLGGVIIFTIIFSFALNLRNVF